MLTHAACSAISCTEDGKRGVRCPECNPKTQLVCMLHKVHYRERELLLDCACDSVKQYRQPIATARVNKLPSNAIRGPRA